MWSKSYPLIYIYIYIFIYKPILSGQGPVVHLIYFELFGSSMTKTGCSRCPLVPLSLFDFSVVLGVLLLKSINKTKTQQHSNVQVQDKGQQIPENSPKWFNVSPLWCQRGPTWFKTSAIWFQRWPNIAQHDPTSAQHGPRLGRRHNPTRSQTVCNVAQKRPTWAQTRRTEANCAHMFCKHLQTSSAKYGPKVVENWICIRSMPSPPHKGKAMAQHDPNMVLI